jgi:hypothetical protein
MIIHKGEWTDFGDVGQPFSLDGAFSGINRGAVVASVGTDAC